MDLHGRLDRTRVPKSRPTGHHQLWPVPKCDPITCTASFSFLMYLNNFHFFLQIWLILEMCILELI
jgi:hypothetical protein